MYKKKVIVVGGVAGGASCAARLRRHGEETEIILFERGKHVSFANCGLPYYIGGVIEEEESLFLADAALFKERFCIDCRLHSEVTSIDTQAKTVDVRSTLDGSTYTESYDELVLAPGSAPICPPLPGIHEEGIFSLRNVPDSNRIKDWIKTHKVKRAIVIGGGFIGLEMIENLIHLGLETSLIERDRQILAPLDPEMSLPLKEALIRHGAKVYLEESVASFEKGPEGLRVTTDKGRVLETDMVILSIGVRPESELAKAAGLNLGPRGHIIVDQNLRTSEPSIYAVGDVIEVRCVVSRKKTALPLAGPANRQGRIVADVISGRGRHFRGVQGTAICGLFELSAGATGLNEKQLNNLLGDTEYAAVYTYPGHHVGYYPGAKTIRMKLLFDTSNGRILGAQAVGEAGVARRLDVIAMAIQMNSTVFDLEESELCYAPQFGSAKDPVNVVGMIAANVMRGDLTIAPWSEIGKKGTVLLDVRDECEIAEQALPNAIHIPLNSLRSRLDELPMDQMILVSCSQGNRAYNAVRLLSNLNYRASLLSGGASTYKPMKDAGIL